jgi:hypothetical protein
LSSARRCFGVAFAALAVAVAMEGCSSVLGIDGEYGDLPEADASNPQPDANDDVRDGATDSDARDGADGDGNDARDVITDAVSDVKVPCETPVGACVNAIPTGWELILFATDRDTGCPQTFTPAELIANPAASAGACECSCTVDSGATCTMGQMRTGYGNDDTCPSTGVPLNVPGPGCTPFSANLVDYFSGEPPPAVVACTPSPVTDDTKVTSSEMRGCEVPSACREEVCNGDVPDGFSGCLVQDGDVACPADWDTRQLVGDGADLSCTDCTCSASAGCTGGLVTFYSDPSCTTLIVAANVDDSCQSTNGGGSIRSYTYAATVSNAQCVADGAKTATVALTGTRTICCK